MLLLLHTRYLDSINSINCLSCFLSERIYNALVLPESSCTLLYPLISRRISFFFNLTATRYKPAPCRQFSILAREREMQCVATDTAGEQSRARARSVRTAT